jgi:hypothetical protein
MLDYDTKRVLKQTIQKAIDNGWNLFEEENWDVHPHDWAMDRWLLCVPDFKHQATLHLSVYEILYSHDFAKALWGDEQHLVEEVYQPDWEYHLQQMVIADDTIAYLSHNI